MNTTASYIIQILKEEGSEHNRAGMARFAIPRLRTLAKTIKKNHPLALELWESGWREARVLASMVANPKQLTQPTMDAWVAEFDGWDLCDQSCSNLFRHSPLAWKNIDRYAAAEDEWTRRTAYPAAVLAVGDKATPDQTFLDYLPLIEHYSTDSRNFVRKAVNWALRQIGKRNLRLHPHALGLALKLKNSPDKTARWIGSDAYRELSTPKILARINP